MVPRNVTIRTDYEFHKHMTHEPTNNALNKNADASSAVKCPEISRHKKSHLILRIKIALNIYRSICRTALGVSVHMSTPLDCTNEIRPFLKVNISQRRDY